MAVERQRRHGNGGETRFGPSEKSYTSRHKTPYPLTHGSSLRDRIGSLVEPKLSNEGSSNKRFKNTNNPLFNLLSSTDSTRTKKQISYSRPHQSGESIQVQAQAKEEPSTRPATSSTEAGRSKVAIKGVGASSNAFNIRGASSTSVSIQNLAPGTTQADVVTILNDKIGEVEHCLTFPVKGGISTTAEVKFGSRIAADKAIALLHGQLADNKRLSVSIMLLPDDNMQEDDYHSDSRRGSQSRMTSSRSRSHHERNTSYHSKGESAFQADSALYQHRDQDLRGDPASSNQDLTSPPAYRKAINRSYRH